MTINLLIVDDDKLMRTSLRLILELEENITVIDDCKNGDEAYQMVLKNHNIDVILMDIIMPICDGVIATKKIIELNKNIKIIVLTTFDDDEYLSKALKYGARGYILKNTLPEKIIESIQIVYKGNLLISNNIAPKISNIVKITEKNFIPEKYNLDVTDMNIIVNISKGHSNREISEKLHLTEGTIKNRVSNILYKLNLRDRTQLAIFYLNNGLLRKETNFFGNR